jgi:hypothetical protein
MRFTELLACNNIPFLTEGHEHCRPGWVQIDCPWCAPHPNYGHFRMGYNLRHKYVNCWSCGHHSLHATLGALLDLQYDKVKLIIDDLDGKYFDPEPEKPAGKLRVPYGVTSLTEVHRDYLIHQRHFQPEVIDLWNLQGICHHPRLGWRIFIPIYFRGRIVSWTTRKVSEASRKPRYLAAPAECESVPHKTLLYGEDFVRHGIVIVEGPTDVWRIGPGAVATCGTGFSKAQILKMSRYPIRAVCFDTAPDAQQQAAKLCDLLEPFPGRTYRVTLDAKDPGSAKAKEIALLRKHFLE